MERESGGGGNKESNQREEKKRTRKGKELLVESENVDGVAVVCDGLLHCINVLCF